MSWLFDEDNESALLIGCGIVALFALFLAVAS